MRNIWTLFLLDLRHLMCNVISAIVTVGIIIVPALYAWFTLSGFWDPYSNTGNLSVAVASEDEGYQSELFPMKVNAGETVIGQLRANDQFKWVFVDSQKAVDGVHSGEYYAAIVIPKDFTQDLMTFFSEDIQHADIVYYSNQEENAIAPRVTDVGASTLQETIDEAFTKTVSNVALSATSGLISFLDGDGIASYANNLIEHLSMVSEEMDTVALETRSFGTLVGATAELASSSSEILKHENDSTDVVKPLLDDANNGITSATAAIDESIALVDGAFADAEAAFSTIEGQVNTTIGSVANTATQTASALDSAAGDLQALIDAYNTVLSRLQAADAPAELTSRVQQAITTLTDLQANLRQAATTLRNGAGTMQSNSADIESQLTAAKNSLAALHTDYSGDIESEGNELKASLNRVASLTSSVTRDLDKTASNLSSASASLSDNLKKIHTALEDTSTTLQQAGDEVDGTIAKLSEALESGDIDRVRDLIGSDPERIASFLSAPTELVTHPVWEIRNNGSAMAPFYSSLAQWIGAIFLVALMTVQVSPARLRKLNNPTANQIYLGRYGVFMVMGILQAIVLVTGNVFFLGVQCEHIALFYLAAVLTSIVFTFIIYTLTVSFGNVGKAIAIVLLVLQLAGSGGIFPVQMSAPFFQAVYPWLPFTHTMEAYQGCIAGIYGNQYWESIGQLLALIIPFAILGLALRHPVARFNEFVNEKLEETKLV